MIIDGKAIAKAVRDNVREKSQRLTRKPSIVAMILGDHPASESYLKMLEKTCETVGFTYVLERFALDMSEAKLLSEIERCNGDKTVDGILVQMPLPPQINPQNILEAIVPHKDLDGFHPLNAGRLFKGEKGTRPCTALAVVTILDALNIDLTGKNAVIIGRSNIVGKPLAIMLLEKNATVTVCHSKTQNLIHHTQNADIVITALGVPKFLKREMVGPHAVVIDVGMNEVDGLLVGDADYENLKDYVRMITPVPGGVGPVTNAVLLLNLLDNMCEV